MDDELELREEDKVRLREEQNRLVKLIEALVNIDQTKEWQTIKELVFDKSLASIEKQLLNESLRSEVDLNKVYKLQGEWTWAKRYSDTNRFVDTLKKQLAEIKKRLQ